MVVILSVQGVLLLSFSLHHHRCRNSVVSRGKLNEEFPCNELRVGIGHKLNRYMGTMWGKYQ